MIDVDVELAVMRKQQDRQDWIVLWVFTAMLAVSTLVVVGFWFFYLPRHFPISQWGNSTSGAGGFVGLGGFLTLVWWGIWAYDYDQNIDWPMAKGGWMPDVRLVFGPFAMAILLWIKMKEHKELARRHSPYNLQHS